MNYQMSYAFKNVQPSVIDCKLPSLVFQTSSETHLGPPEFIQTPQKLPKVESVQEPDEDTLSTTSSRCSIDEKLNDKDSLSQVSGISNLFEDEINHVVIPLSEPKHKITESLDKSEFLDCILNDENHLHPFYSNVFNENVTERFRHTSSYVTDESILNKCEEKTNMLNNLFGQVVEKLHYVEENLPKLGIGINANGSTPRMENDTKCPYKKLLKEYCDKGDDEFMHETYVVFERKK